MIKQYQNIIKKELLQQDNCAFLNFSKINDVENNIEDFFQKDELNNVFLFEKLRWIISNNNTSDDLEKKLILFCGELPRIYKGYFVDICSDNNGGLAPYFLVNNRNANVIITDINTSKMRKWDKLLKYLFFPNTTSMVIDACNMPFENEKLDVVSTHNGLFNINKSGFDYKLAIKEIGRVIKNGGMFIQFSFRFDKEDLKKLDSDSMIKLKKKYPSLLDDINSEFKKMGFSNIKEYCAGQMEEGQTPQEIINFRNEIKQQIGLNYYLSFYQKNMVKKDIK